MICIDLTIVPSGLWFVMIGSFILPVLLQIGGAFDDA